QDPAGRARSGARSADHRSCGRLRGCKEDAGSARGGSSGGAAGARKVDGHPDGYRAYLRRVTLAGTECWQATVSVTPNAISPQAFATAVCCANSSVTADAILQLVFPLN